MKKKKNETVETTIQEEKVVYFDELFGKKADNDYVTVAEDVTSEVNCDSIVDKAKRKLCVEGWIQALLTGGIVSLSAMFVVATVIWALESTQYWISLIVFGAAFVLATPLAYLIKYRPTDKKVAERIDELGLEERTLTMQEYQNDDSVVAKRQRKDALNVLSKFKINVLKIVASVPLVIICTTALVLGGGMTTVSGLTANGSVQNGATVGGGAIDPSVTYEVNYKVTHMELILGVIPIYVEDEGGEIVGESFQVVAKGDKAVEVTAVPHDGYGFYQWSDGYKKPTRTIDVDVQGNITVTAIFMEINPDGEPDDGEDGEPGDGEPSEEPGDPNGSSNDSSGNGEESEAKTEEKNQVLDGNTYYGGETYEDAKNNTMDSTSKDGNMSDDMKDLIEDYFEAIKKNN